MRSLVLFCLLPACGCTAVGIDRCDGPAGRCALRPCQDAAPHVAEVCAGVPKAAKDHTHVYFINGLDPLYFANFNGLAHRVKEQGFTHCLCGQMGHTAAFGREIRKLGPGERVALVGYSFGANCVRELAQDLARDGVRVDLLVYVGGDTVLNTAHSRPANVGRILNLTGHGHLFLGRDLICCGADLDGAVNHRRDARHFHLPSEASTVEYLLLELAAVSK